jgi:hypothetical protein
MYVAGTLSPFTTYSSRPGAGAVKGMTGQNRSSYFFSFGRKVIQHGRWWQGGIDFVDEVQICQAIPNGPSSFVVYFTRFHIYDQSLILIRFCFTKEGVWLCWT